MLAVVKELFEVWTVAVTVAVQAIRTRIVPQRRVELTENEAGHFTARLILAPNVPALPPFTFKLAQDSPQPELTADWKAVLRGSRIDVIISPEHVLFCAIDFPKQAADFLEGMVRSQIDRLTPWSAGEALFGTTAPVPIANERIELTLAATSAQKIQPLLALAADWGVASVAGLAQMPDAGPIKLFDQLLSGAAGSAHNVTRLLRMTLLGAGFAAAASLLISTYLGSEYAAEQQELQERITQRRAAMRIRPDSTAETLLVKRKQSSPSSVITLEAISRVLPDTTYVTELHVEGNKIQVVGVTQDAPSLIKLIEQSPQFTRATFFAPTTRSHDEAGERFHIEAQVTAYFGPGL
ncbi:PilN domain-containing protein [Bradyrhizobium sp. KB893862 SZCCT0404]|uniref:PilN domain-containing protein n=1 Tax=Bradyrhizobium sp. KB893862 SZCCT0404 TaxID=2807672 RepID=UPI001BAD28D1|nr:PilN domain-containing protein [Bradyrhizobium sp. KB893862 SZCCT0404]MBR1175257.1 PilN domain-containing protein [Bradyrhizobium sp. KB893862 SZCCT0404]